MKKKLSLILAILITLIPIGLTIVINLIPETDKATWNCFVGFCVVPVIGLVWWITISTKPVHDAIEKDKIGGNNGRA